MENKRFKANSANERWLRPQSIRQADIKRRTAPSSALQAPPSEKRRISQTKISAPAGSVSGAPPSTDEQGKRNSTKAHETNAAFDEPGGGALSLKFKNWVKNERLESAAWMSRTFSQQHNQKSSNTNKYKSEVVTVETVGSLASLDPALKYLPVIVRKQAIAGDNNQNESEVAEELFLAFHLLVDHPQMDLYHSTVDSIAHQSSSQQTLPIIKEGMDILLFDPHVKFLESRMFHRFRIMPARR